MRLKPKYIQCEGCCISGTKCACKKCYPRVLCALVKISDNAATTTCCNFKFFMSCTGEGSWGGSATCYSSSVSVSASVRVLRDEDGKCYTEVTCGSVVADFDGVLPVGISVDFTGSDSNTYTLTIRKGDTVQNPYVQEKCSPCAGKSTCLPKYLCITAVCGNCTTNGQRIYTWNCHTWAWEGDPVACNRAHSSPGMPGTPDIVTYTVQVLLLGKETGKCGITIQATGDNGSTGSVEILFTEQSDSFATNSLTMSDDQMITVAEAACGDCTPLLDSLHIPYCGCIDMPFNISMSVIPTDGCVAGVVNLILASDRCNPSWVASVFYPERVMPPFYDGWTTWLVQLSDTNPTIGLVSFNALNHVTGTVDNLYTYTAIISFQCSPLEVVFGTFLVAGDQKPQITSCPDMSAHYYTIAITAAP